MGNIKNDDKEMFLAEIFQDFNITKTYIEKILEEIHQNDISNYPILVLSKEEILLGIKIIDNTDFDTNWSFNISHLEELVSKDIVLAEKAQDFIKVYKEHNNHFCLFIRFNEDEADFAYINKNQI